MRRRRGSTRTIVPAPVVLAVFGRVGEPAVPRMGLLVVRCGRSGSVPRAVLVTCFRPRSVRKPVVTAREDAFPSSA